MVEAGHIHPQVLQAQAHGRGKAEAGSHSAQHMLCRCTSMVADHDLQRDPQVQQQPVEHSSPQVLIL